MTGKEGHPLGIVQNDKILPFWLMAEAQTRICPSKSDV